MLSTTTIIATLLLYCCGVLVHGNTVTPPIPAAGHEGTEFISGHAYYQLARFNGCARYPDNFDVTKLKDGDIVFMNTEKALYLQRQFKANPLPTGTKVKVIFHNSDASFGPKDYGYVEPNVHRVYAANNVCTSTECPKVWSVPLGFVDSHAHLDKAHSVFRKVATEAYHNESLVFLGFTVSTNTVARTNCVRAFHDATWVHNWQNHEMLPGQYYRTVAATKYVLSPPGAGYDCHRVYESMYLGTIPILLTSPLDHLHEQFPLLIVRNWAHVNQQYLEECYADHLLQVQAWHRRNPRWTEAAFWIDREEPFVDDPSHEEAQVQRARQRCPMGLLPDEPAHANAISA